MSRHKCPADGCPSMVPADLLACFHHWYQIPRPLRSAVWRERKHGTPESHRAAITAAIDALREVAR